VTITGTSFTGAKKVTFGGVKATVFSVDSDTQITRMSQETVAAQNMLTRFTQWQGREPESVAARHDVRERRVLAMVGGSEHHSVYPNPRQYSPKEQPVLNAVNFRCRSRHLCRNRCASN
jgi:hypothetical protein